MERKTELNIEKPPSLYHGSTQEIAGEIEPRNRFTPAEGMGTRVYASDLPAFAVGHAFPWHSGEGIDLSINNGKVTLTVPIQYKERLVIPVFIYKISSENFRVTAEEQTGHTFDSDSPIKTESRESFPDIKTAMEHFGGTVVYV